MRRESASELCQADFVCGHSLHLAWLYEPSMSARCVYQPDTIPPARRWTFLGRQRLLSRASGTLSHKERAKADGKVSGIA